MQAEGISKHGEIYNILESRILSGKWTVGLQMPTEMELASEFNCSRSTIGKALARLVHEGLIVRKPRLGTRVVRQSSGRAKSGFDLNAYAFIFPSRQHEGVWRTVQGFQAAAQRTNRRVLLLSTDADYTKETEFLGRLSEFDVRAGAIFPVLSTPEDIVLFSKVVVASTFPIVMTELAMPGLPCSAVLSDNFHAGYTMTRHVIQRGAKRIGFFTNNAWSPSLKDRLKGYRWAMEEAGLPEQPDTIFMERGMRPNFDDPLAEPIELARRYLKTTRKMDAVVCGYDYLAVGCLTAARELGLKVPHDLKITGLDDFRIASEAVVPLTTYHTPYEEIGEKVFALLDAPANAPKEEIQVRGSLVIRQTT